MDSVLVRFLGNYQTEAQINLFTVQNAIISRFKNVLDFRYFRYFISIYTSGIYTDSVCWFFMFFYK